MEFAPGDDEASGGNLPLDAVLGFARQDLDTFFTTEVDANYPVPGDLVDGPCDGEIVALAYCASDGQIHGDVDRLQGIHDYFGDFATITLLTRAFAATINAERQVANCLVGAFVHTLLVHAGDNPPTYNLQMSAGDLDEAVRVALFESTDGDGILSVESIRAGVIQGVPACTAIAGN